MVAGSFAAGVLATVAIGRLRRRHAYRYRPPEPGRDLDPGPDPPDPAPPRADACKPTTSAELAADQRRQCPVFPVDDDERRLDPGWLEIGTRDGAAVTVEVTDLSGVAMSGPVVDDVARALVAGLLVRAVPGATEILLTDELADRLLPGLADDRALRRVRSTDDSGPRRRGGADRPHPTPGRGATRPTPSSFRHDNPENPLPLLVVLLDYGAGRIARTVGRRCSPTRPASASPSSSSTTSPPPPARLDLDASGTVTDARPATAPADLDGAALYRLAAPTRPSNCSARSTTPTTKPTKTTPTGPNPKARSPRCTPTATPDADSQSSAGRRALARDRPISPTGRRPADRRRDARPVPHHRPRPSRSPPACGAGPGRCSPGTCSAPKAPPSTRPSTPCGPTPTPTRSAASSGGPSATCAPGCAAPATTASKSWRRSASTTAPTRPRSPATCGASKPRSATPPEPTTTSTARAALRRAVDTYRGDLLSGVGYPWVEPVRQDLHRRALDAHLRLAELDDRAGHPELAVDVLERAIDLDRYAEEPYRRLMALHAAHGRPDAVTATWQLLRSRLADLDVDMDETTARLYRTLTTDRRPQRRDRSGSRRDPRQCFPGLDSPGRIAGTRPRPAWSSRRRWSGASDGRSPLAAYSFLAATGAVVSATDFAARRVPNLIVLPAYPIAAVLLVVASAPSGRWWPLARAGIAAAGLGGFYLALGLAFPAGMGLGDVKWAGRPRRLPRLARLVAGRHRHPDRLPGRRCVVLVAARVVGRASVEPADGHRS